MDSFVKEVWNYWGFPYYTVSSVGVKEAKKICFIWNILSKDIQKEIEKEKSFYLLGGIIDVAHIEPKSININKKFDPHNTILIMRFFHKRLTECRHPITNKHITNKEVLDYMRKIQNNSEKILILEDNYE